MLRRIECLNPYLAENLAANGLETANITEKKRNIIKVSSNEYPISLYKYSGTNKDIRDKEKFLMAREI